MKYIVASDIHGSAYFTEMLIKRIEEEKADKLILLGDIYNHGPRNPLPEKYNPMKVSELLNSIANQLIVIKGNCDSEVDTLISDFDFVENTVLSVNDKTLFLSHGHIYNCDNLPKTKFDVIIYGHFHTGFIERKNGVIIANPGSISLPKNGTQESYLLIDNGKLILKDISGKVIKEEKL